MTSSSLSAEATRLSFGNGAAVTLHRDLPVETAVNIVYAPVPYAVMMATPEDLEDFAYGFSLTEGIVDRAADIRSIVAEPEADGIRLVVTLASDHLKRHLGRSRAMTGRTGCGLCGIDDLKHLPHASVRSGQGVPVPLASIHAALVALESAQPLNTATRAVHAAAFAGCDGTLKIVREDVGRHNALDKMIGAAMRGAVDPADGFVLITSRCSFEMVEKAAVFGARLIVAISAPTSLAVERARLHGIGLMAIARPDSGMIFTNPETIAAGAEYLMENLA